MADSMLVLKAVDRAFTFSFDAKILIQTNKNTGNRFLANYRKMAMVIFNPKQSIHLEHNA